MNTRGTRTLPITPERRRKLEALWACAMWSRWDRRFVGKLWHVPDTYRISLRQAEYIDTLHFKYRRQIAPEDGKTEVSGGGSLDSP